jgi:hypothetical protein
MLFGDCRRENLLQNNAESTKVINGTWKIINASRNGTDLTSRFNFSHFSITFNDGSYTLDSIVPFVVAQNGSYHLDDPQYPYKIYFQAQNDSTKELDFQYPVINGVRNIILVFSPGCSSNNYIYTLQKVN